MIREQVINDIISSSDIASVIEKCGVTIKRYGSTLKGCCPFHNEKTPSFVVYQKTQTFVCFGCGESGNVVKFLMKYKNLNFVEAIKELANDAGITIEETKPNPEAERLHKERESVYIVYESAAKFYAKELLNYTGDNDQTNPLLYAKGRFTDETIVRWQLGYAPDSWNGLYNELKKQGFTEDIISKSGLCKEKKTDGYYDFFRGRLMFPILSRTGKVIAFSGRQIVEDKNSGKYINSAESIIYSKKEQLFGLNYAWHDIKKYDVCVLVEGNADVVKLHQLDINNVVAACGTALSKEQIQEIAKITKNFCLLYDSDSAGVAATKRNAELILSGGYNVLVLQIPCDEKGNKQDPDSFFTSKEEFAQFYTENKIDYILSYAKSKAENCTNDPAYKSKTIKHLSRLFYGRSETERSVLVNELCKIIPKKTDWNKALNEIGDEAKVKVKTVEENGRTNEQNKSIEKYGFYVEKNCYYFQREGGFYKGSNFILEPLFHIESTINAKRLYKTTNEYNVVKVLEFPQKDLISISAFKLRCESCGNFRFDAGDIGLSKIKAYLYEKTKTCQEITQLGWQKQGFFAWSNGIVEYGKFTPISEDGICTHNSDNFYIPALSSFYKSDDMLFQFERKFKHIQGTIELQTWVRKFYKVYGENAVVGFSYYIASLFRDIIVNHFRFFPILNIFGPKGTGKSEMAISMSKLFGDLPVGLNMTNSTLPAMADHVSHTKNALCHIDEYKNSVDYEKIEFLKGLWDGTGRSRMNMDKDKKKEMTAVDSGIVLTGQEMCTADIALFSRVLFLSFSKYTFTDLERSQYAELKEIEKLGLTHITNQLLQYRSLFLEKYMETYNKTSKELEKLLNKSNIEDRIWRNWTVVLAALNVLTEKIELPQLAETAMTIFVQKIKEQNEKIKSGNELATFWDIFSYLSREGLIENKFDYVIKRIASLKTDKLDIRKEMCVIYVDMTRVMQLYAKHGKCTSQKILPLDTLKYYLQNSQEYLGKKVIKLKQRFSQLQDRSVATEYDGYDSYTKVLTHPCKCFCFEYDQLNLDIESFMVNQDEELVLD